MGIQKFRTFEDARHALWLEAGDPEILIRMRRLGELAPAAHRPHGVFRYRTIEEAKGDKGLGQRRRLP